MKERSIRPFAHVAPLPRGCKSSGKAQKDRRLFGVDLQTSINELVKKCPKSPQRAIKVRAFADTLPGMKVVGIGGEVVLCPPPTHGLIRSLHNNRGGNRPEHGRNTTSLSNTAPNWNFGRGRGDLQGNTRGLCATGS